MDKQELEKYIDLGYSSYKIAQDVGKSASTIKYWLCKYQLGTKMVCKCKCGEDDPSKFSPGRYTYCKKCKTKTQTDLHKGYKEKSVEYKGGKCVKCGYKKCMAALDFHHVDPKEKDPNWRTMRSWSFERVKSELDKCILVCRNCHAEIHYG